MTLDQDAIRALLPHRPPLLLPHRVEIRRKGEHGVGLVTLDLNSRLWDAWHARELFQELVMEGAAQVLGLVLASARDEGRDVTGDERHLLLGFNRVAFASEAGPVPELEIDAVLVQRMGATCRGRFVAREISGHEIARGELTVMQG